MFKQYHYENISQIRTLCQYDENLDGELISASNRFLQKLVNHIFYACFVGLAVLCD